jgi:hypothetical protein
MNNSKSREIIMGVFAFVILIIYALLQGKMILTVYSWDPKNGDLIFSENTLWIINIIGGLVSGVVVGNFALSDPGKAPNSQVKKLSTEYGKYLIAIIWVYVGIWFIIGLGSFYVGVMQRPDVNETLSEIGKSWIGILLAALYAWFGIKK